MRKYPDDGYGLRSRLYNIWRCMYMRCYYPSHEAFDRYGGAGITICEEWKHDYLAFKEWALRNGYSACLTIDRKDNNLGYSPDNCRWITMKEQQANRRDNLNIQAFGEIKTAKEWSRDPRCQIGYVGLHRRLTEGVDPELAITTPSRIQKKNVHPHSLTAFGETKSLQEWITDPRCKVPLATIYWRINRQGWTHEECLTLAPRSRNVACNLPSNRLRK